jgi:hypothetical protein
VVNDVALLEIGVRRLLSRYADVVSRRAWPELESQFAPGCHVVVDRRDLEPIVLDGAHGVGEFVGAAIERFEFFEFTILNAVIDPVAGDTRRATGRLWMCELRQDAASHEWSNAYGVYHDDYAQDPDGAWRFAQRRYHSLARTATPGPALQVFPFPQITPSPDR